MPRMTRAQRSAIGDQAARTISIRRKPTPAQEAKLKELREAFGKDTIKAHAPQAGTGHMRVEATAQAGVWEWTFTTSGELVYSCMTMALWNEGTDDGQQGPSTLPTKSSHYKHA